LGLAADGAEMDIGDEDRAVVAARRRQVRRYRACRFGRFDRRAGKDAGSEGEESTGEAGHVVSLGPGPARGRESGPRDARGSYRPCTSFLYRAHESFANP